MGIKSSSLLTHQIKEFFIVLIVQDADLVMMSNPVRMVIIFLAEGAIIHLAFRRHMKRKQISVYVTDETARQIAELARLWGLPDQRHNTPIIEKSIERIYQQEVEMRSKAQDALENIDRAKTNEELLEAADKAIAALQALPPEQQEEIAKQEILRWREYFKNRYG